MTVEELRILCGSGVGFGVRRVNRDATREPGDSRGMLVFGSECPLDSELCHTREHRVSASAPLGLTGVSPSIPLMEGP